LRTPQPYNCLMAVESYHVSDQELWFRCCAGFRIYLVSGQLADSKNFQEIPTAFPRTYRTPGGMLQMFCERILRRNRPMARQTTIKIATESLILLSSSSTRRSWCPICAAEEEMLSLEIARALCSEKSELLEDWLASARVHHARATDGSCLICLRSLVDRLQNKNPT